MTTIDYTETFLPELGYLVAERGSVELLNHAAGLFSYFERHDVLRCGREVYGTRGDDRTLATVCDVIASSTVAFTVKSTVLPELTTMYFPADIGVAEVSLVADQTFVTLYPPDWPVATLLQRHLQSESALIVRRGVDGSHSEIAVSGSRHAIRDSDNPWRAGKETDSLDLVVRRFTE
ncbi:hypothetical protein [Mycobacterium sp. 141]|uniref:hypothetical protein n=1 Tax=Mycobacterium sp. 141 TaxID=1120797 RepID=UPI00037221F6|nr:hypothetical protein [Mycobacterium sp. 141]